MTSFLDLPDEVRLVIEIPLAQPIQFLWSITICEAQRSAIFARE
jgi:hypothetical protein